MITITNSTLKISPLANQICLNIVLISDKDMMTLSPLQLMLQYAFSLVESATPELVFLRYA